MIRDEWVLIFASLGNCFVNDGRKGRDIGQRVSGDGGKGRSFSNIRIRVGRDIRYSYANVTSLTELRLI